jgi:high-affinity K+ transport system ATPase subunit B
MLPNPPETLIGKILFFVVFGIGVAFAFTALWPALLMAAVVYVIQKIVFAAKEAGVSAENKAKAHQDFLTKYHKQEAARKEFEAAQPKDLDGIIAKLQDEARKAKG